MYFPTMEMISSVLVGLPLTVLIFGLWRFCHGYSRERSAAASAQSTLMYLGLNQRQPESYVGEDSTRLEYLLPGFAEEGVPTVFQIKLGGTIDDLVEQLIAKQKNCETRISEQLHCYLTTAVS